MSKADDLRTQREAAQVAYEKASKSSRGGVESRNAAAVLDGEGHKHGGPVVRRPGRNKPTAGVASGPRDYKSGRGPGPSTPAVDVISRPSVSRRGGPDYKCPVCEARKVAHRLRAAKHRAKKEAKAK